MNKFKIKKNRLISKFKIMLLYNFTYYKKETRKNKYLQKKKKKK